MVRRRRRKIICQSETSTGIPALQMEYYDRAVDTSVQDCMRTDTNGPYRSAEKANTFPCATDKDLCCRGWECSPSVWNCLLVT